MSEQENPDTKYTDEEQMQTQSSCGGCGQVGIGVGRYNPNEDMLVFPKLMVNRHHVLYFEKGDDGNAIAIIHDGKKHVNTGATWEDVSKTFR